SVERSRHDQTARLGTGRRQGCKSDQERAHTGAVWGARDEFECRAEISPALSAFRAWDRHGNFIVGGAGGSALIVHICLSALLISPRECAAQINVLVQANPTIGVGVLDRRDSVQVSLSSGSLRSGVTDCTHGREVCLEQGVSCSSSVLLAVGQ